MDNLNLNHQDKDPKDKPMPFEDYYKIHQLAHQTGKGLEEQLAPEVYVHDNDYLTYQQAYQFISKLLADMTKYTDTYGSVAMDAIGGLVAMLVAKKYLSDKDVQVLQANLSKAWDNNNK